MIVKRFASQIQWCRSTSRRFSMEKTVTATARLQDGSCFNVRSKSVGKYTCRAVKSLSTGCNADGVLCCTSRTVSSGY